MRYNRPFFLLAFTLPFCVACGGHSAMPSMPASAQVDSVQQTATSQVVRPIPSGAPTPPDDAQRSLIEHRASLIQWVKQMKRKKQSTQADGVCPPGFNFCFMIAEGQQISMPLTGNDQELLTCGYNAEWDVNYGSDSHVLRTFNPVIEPPGPSFTTTTTMTALPGSGGLNGASYIIGFDMDHHWFLHLQTILQRILI